MTLEKHYRRICPLCLGKMAMLLGPKDWNGEYLWSCDDCKLLITSNVVLMVDRVKKYIED
jgi:Zn-finger protein